MRWCNYWKIVIRVIRSTRSIENDDIASMASKRCNHDSFTLSMHLSSLEKTQKRENQDFRMALGSFGKIHVALVSFRSIQNWKIGACVIWKMDVALRVIFLFQNNSHHWMRLEKLHNMKWKSQFRFFCRLCRLEKYTTMCPNEMIFFSMA